MASNEPAPGVSPDWLYGPPQGDDPLWLCGNRRTYVALSKMTDGHLLNVERFLLGHGAETGAVRQALFGWWYDTIRDEIDRRGLGGHLYDTHPAALRRQEYGSEK